MRLQKLWIAFACVLLLALPAMAADASISGLPTGSARLSGSGSVDLTPLDITPPPVPDAIKVPDGNELFLVGHALGTQNYVCQSTGSSATDVAYVLFTPQATLFDHGEQVITHYFSPNPFEPNTNPAVVAPGTIRATWQATDTSIVWAKATGSAAVTPGAIAWVRLQAVGTQDGPTGGDTLTATTFVQRLNTSGGLAPSTGCASRKDIGNQAFVPYTADYFFYKAD